MLQDDNKKLQSIIDELRESNKKLSKASDVAYMEILNRSNDKLKADNDRLVEQVGSNSNSSSSTHTHTISKEVNDYMRHHPEYKEVRLFVYYMSLD